MMVTQAREGLYHDWRSINAFLPLAIEVFGYLHQQANDFFHRYANKVWSTKCISSLPLIVLHAFYKQKMLVTS
jgi:hypothetical protein